MEKKEREVKEQASLSVLHVLLPHFVNLISLIVTHGETENMRIAFRCAEVSNYLVFKNSSSSVTL